MDGEAFQLFNNLSAVAEPPVQPGEMGNQVLVPPKPEVPIPVNKVKSQGLNLFWNYKFKRIVERNYELRSGGGELILTKKKLGVTL